MTRETCGLAVVDDQLSLVTDVMLEKGIEAVPEIAGAIQRKEKFARDWVVAYDLHRSKFNKEKSMRTVLGNPYKDAYTQPRHWRSFARQARMLQSENFFGANQKPPLRHFFLFF